jgi:hypothetical protein
MLMLVGPILFVLLGVMAVRARKAGLSGWEVALIVILGTLCIVAAMFGILIWGFRDFG